jgi:cell division protein FtsB
MSTNNLLRKQVASEIKKRNLTFITFVVLCFLYLTISLILGDRGLLRYRELMKTKGDLERQVAEIKEQNEQIKTQLQLLKEDPFFREKFAREEFGLAKPDEYIFQYER